MQLSYAAVRQARSLMNAMNYQGGSMTTNIDLIRDNLIAAIDLSLEQGLLTEQEVKAWKSDLSNGEYMPSLEEFQLSSFDSKTVKRKFI